MMDWQWQWQWRMGERQLTACLLCTSSIQFSLILSLSLSSFAVYCYLRHERDGESFETAPNTKVQLSGKRTELPPQITNFTCIIGPRKVEGGDFLVLNQSNFLLVFGLETVCDARRRIFQSTVPFQLQGPLGSELHCLLQKLPGLFGRWPKRVELKFQHS